MKLKLLSKLSYSLTLLVVFVLSSVGVVSAAQSEISESQTTQTSVNSRAEIPPSEQQNVSASDALSLNNKTVLNQDAKKLAEILADTLTYQADFEQNVYRENSDKAEVTKGQFLIQRPNHFRWETISPFEQSIVADGKNLWTYDPELEQVSLQNQQAVLADSPLLLLTSSVESLIKAFDIKLINNKSKDGQDLFALTPRENSLFESVHILIEGNKIKEFFLLDTLGGRTSVIFSNIHLNQQMDTKTFLFVPPEGVDLIDSREVIDL
jgi:outer membrane lipoprotein carrier protein